MKRFVKRLRRPSRWPEETHMLIAGLITIGAIFAVLFFTAWYVPVPTPVAITRPVQ